MTQLLIEPVVLIVVQSPVDGDCCSTYDFHGKN